MEPSRRGHDEGGAPPRKVERASRGSFTLPALFLLFLSAAAVVAYLPSLHSPMVFDDSRNIEDNPSIQVTRLDRASLSNAAFPAGNLNLRPLAFLNFALNYRLGGIDPFGFHVANLLILLLSIPVVFWLALLLVRTLSRSSEGIAPALAVTAIWTMNPLLTNGVTYIVQRMTSLSTLFSLIALAFFIRGRIDRRPAWYAAAFLSWSVALAAKENALLLPLLALLFIWFTSPENSAARRRTGALLAGTVILTQSALILFSHYLVALRWIPKSSFSLTQRFLTESRVILKYLTLWFLPLPSRMNLDHEFPLSSSLFSPPATFLTILVHTSLLLTAFSLRRRRPLFSFAMFSFYILQLAEGTFLPIDIIFEHRVYFPSFFLALALVDLCVWCLEKGGAKRSGVILLGLAVLTGSLWGLLTYQRNSTWSDPLRLWQDVVDKSPSSARALTNLGKELNNAGRHLEAVTVLRRSNELEPHSAETLHNLGNSLVSSGSHREALRVFEMSLAIDPDSAKIYNSVAVVNSMLGRHEEAIRNFRKAIERMPAYSTAHYNLGLAYAKQGNREGALAEYRILRTTNPALAAALLREINRTGS